MWSKPSIERTTQRPLRALCAAAHVEHQALRKSRRFETILLRRSRPAAVGGAEPEGYFGPWYPMPPAFFIASVASFIVRSGVVR